MPDEFKHCLSSWEWSIENEFEIEAKKALCARNKANRTKNPNPINHRSGPKPFSHRAIELAKEGSQAPFVEAVVNMYKSCPNAEERVEKLKRSLEEISQSNPPPSEDGTSSEAARAPLAIEEQRNILASCLGERRGTEVRGLGGTHRRPPKKRGGPWDAAAAEEMRQLEERAAKAEEAAAKAQIDARLAKEEASSASLRLTALEDVVRG